jgi:hypothetical protein
MAYVFVSERGSPLTARTVHHIVAEAGRAAGFAFPVYPHMLRHACGFYLANKGVDTRALQQYLGHRNIQHTVRYTELTAQRFQNFLGGLRRPFGLLDGHVATGQQEDTVRSWRRMTARIISMVTSPFPVDD